MIPITCNAVGDIIALATLLLDIAHTLDEAHGAPAKYRKFNGELKSLHIVLASVGRVAELTTDALLRDEIMREVNRCGKDVRRALERVAKFSVLEREGSADDTMRVRIKRQWYKLEWRFGWHGSVEAIREDLASATQRLTVYLVTSNADGIQSLGVSITSQFDAMTARICTMVMEHFAAVDVRDTALTRSVHNNTAVLGQLTSRRLPPTLPGPGLDSNKAAAAALLCYAICTMQDSSRSGHTALLLAAFGILMFGLARDGRAIVPDVKYTKSNSITFNDAMGRRLVLPLELCETQDLFHTTLVNLFSRTSGRWFVDAHRYVLRHDNGSLIYNGDDRDIQPGTEVVMFIIVKQAGEYMDADTVQCPRCLFTEAWTPGSWTRRCSGCGAYLQDYFGSLKPLDVFADDAQRAPQKSTVLDVNDRGRFPRARQTSSMPVTQRHNSMPPSNHRVTPSSSHGRLSDIDNQLDAALDWRHEVRAFTRFALSQTSFLGFHSQAGLPANSLSRSRTKSLPDLHLAAENGHYALAAELLGRGMDVDATVAPGYTALHMAALSGQIHIVELLLDRGATIDALTEHNITPLACALNSGELEAATLLVARGAMADASESVRAAALIAATRIHFNVGIMQMLLQLGIDVNRPFHSETALQVAVNSGGKEIVEFLLRNGADVNVRDKRGDKLLSIAARQGNVGIFKLLWASGGMANHALHTASEQDIRRLLHQAVRGGSHVIVAIVFQHTGVDVNARLEDGTTPLSLASGLANDKVVELLLSLGAEPNVEALLPGWMEKKGSWKPLHAAAYGVAVEVIEILLQHGADVNARTEKGDTPLSLGLESKHEYLMLESWSSDAPARIDKVLDTLLSWSAVVDERSSLLLEEITRLCFERFDVPGAWCEDVEHDL